MTSESALVPYSIENQIHLVRGQKVLLDTDLATLYDVEVRALNQAVKRNENRFPSDFVFQLTAEESAGLKSQTVISSGSHGGRRNAPYAFTEHGAIMAASVLVLIWTKFPFLDFACWRTAIQNLVLTPSSSLL